MTASLGFATDVALRLLEGARAEGGAPLVVRTRSNPGFRWGNFLLSRSVAEGPEHWAAEHGRAFPDAGFVAIGLDDPDPVLDDRRWGDAGFEVERLVVLEAPATTPAGADRPGLRVLESDADWRSLIDIEADEAGGVEDALYAERRLAQRRAMVATGSAVWLGAEVDGGVVATLGVAEAGDGIARFQDVQTLRAFRRRGLAGALVAAGARAAVERFGSRRLVIVAEPDGAAIGLYRRLGFRDRETQLQLTRVDGAVGAAP